MRCKLVFCLFILCVLCGCGPVAAALGIFQLVQEDKKKTDTPTVVVNLAVTGAALVTEAVRIDYILADSESSPASVLVEFSLDGGQSWHGCTAAPGSEGTTGLSTSPGGGIPHFFVELGG